MRDIRVEVDTLTLFEGMNLPSQGKFQISFHDIDEFFTLMFVFHRLVVTVRFDCHHEGPQVALLGTGCEGLVRIAAGTFNKGLSTLVSNYFLFLFIIGFNFIFESMLEAQSGVVFYAFFNVFLFTTKDIIDL